MERMGKKRSGGEAPAGPATPFHDAFAKLRDRLPAGGSPPAEPRADRTVPGEPSSSPLHAKRAEGAEVGPARAVVRIERKGRGGKEATLVEKLELPSPALERWLEEAKRALGCGGSVEDGALVLQGDQRERVARWLERRGVRKVTLGT
jgi:translation initiation factor 1